MADDQNITILTVSWDSSEDLRNLIKNLIHKASKPDSLEFLIIDNMNGNDPNLPDLTHLHAHVTIVPNKAGYEIGSQNHASGLNAALPHVKTPYLLITDPDVYMFRKDWDLFIVEEILEKTEFIGGGTCYPPWQLGKYHNSPSPVFAFFRMETFSALSPDWMCYNESRARRLINIVFLLILRCYCLMTRNRFVRHRVLAGLLVFLEERLPVCSCETGWLIARKIRESRLETALFRPVLPGALDPAIADRLSRKATNAANELAENFELYTYGEQLILTHRYSSQARLWRTDRGHDHAFWRNCIETIDRE